MEIIKEDKEKLIFKCKIGESLANAIRRSVQEIPVLAIDEVEFYKNDSALYDEILAHRLGLVPLKNQKLTEKEKCSCKGKGCTKCTIQLKLSAKGPCTVYSGDLKGRAEIVYDKMPIVILNEGQEVELVASACVGRGKEHVKFSPGLVYYRNVPKIDISKECNLCEACVEACPQKILKKGKNKIGVSEAYKCDLCEACVEACKKEGKNAIKLSLTDEIIFFVESFGQMDAKEIIIGAIDALKTNLLEVKKVVGR